MTMSDHSILPVPVGDIDRDVDTLPPESSIEASPTVSEKKRNHKLVAKNHRQIGYRDNRTLKELRRELEHFQIVQDFK